MAEKITMPKLGSSMVSGTVVRWMKKEGDSVSKGEPIVEIETDKITNEVEAPIDGYLLKILAAEGEERDILEPLAIVGQAGETVG